MGQARLRILPLSLWDPWGQPWGALPLRPPFSTPLLPTNPWSLLAPHPLSALTTLCCHHWEGAGSTAPNSLFSSPTTRESFSSKVSFVPLSPPSAPRIRGQPAAVVTTLIPAVPPALVSWMVGGAGGQSWAQEPLWQASGAGKKAGEGGSGRRQNE